jgi:hypothetical protein
VAGMQLQIGVPNLDESRFDDNTPMSRMGKVEPPDDCPGKVTFGMPLLSYVSSIT